MEIYLHPLILETYPKLMHPNTTIPLHPLLPYPITPWKNTDYAKAVESRQRLDSQLQENKLVQDEFKLLKDDANIYKLIGPVLTKQDKTEAVTNVDKRIDFIQAEM